MKNEYYSWYKEHHICPFCRVNKPVGNHVYCHECRAKYREYQEKRIDRNRDEIYQKNRERYYRYKEQGLCVSCGKPAVPGKVFCQKCANKKNRKKTSEKVGKCNGPTMAMGRRTSLLSLWKTCNRGSQAMSETL